MKKIILILIFIMFSTAALQAVNFKVKNVMGKAQHRNIKSTKWNTVKIGDIINENHRIRVANKAVVMLMSENGSIITLKDQTIFDVSQLISDSEKSVSRFRLYYGKFKAVVNKLKSDKSKWEIMTPTAVVGVRGTVLGIHVNNMLKNEIAVFKGKVEVRNNRNIGKPVMVETQQKVVVERNAAPPAPKRLAVVEKSFDTWIEKKSKETPDSGGLPTGLYDMPDWLQPYDKDAGK